MTPRRSQPGSSSRTTGCGSSAPRLCADDDGPDRDGDRNEPGRFYLGAKWEIVSEIADRELHPAQHQRELHAQLGRLTPLTRAKAPSWLDRALTFVEEHIEWVDVPVQAFLIEPEIAGRQQPFFKEMLQDLPRLLAE